MDPTGIEKEPVLMQPSFTIEDVRLIRRIADRWQQLSEAAGLAGAAGDLARIADAIEAEVNGRPSQGGPLGGLRPGDGGRLRVSIPVVRDGRDAAAARDLAKRINVRAGKKLIHRNPDGSSIVLTATTITHRAGRRRK